MASLALCNPKPSPIKLKSEKGEIPVQLLAEGKSLYFAAKLIILEQTVMEYSQYLCRVLATNLSLLVFEFQMSHAIIITTNKKLSVQRKTFLIFGTQIDNNPCLILLLALTVSS